MLSPRHLLLCLPLILALTFLWHLPAGAQLTPQDLFQLTSPDFGQGGPLPKRFTADDENVSPTLEIAGTPAGTVSLVLIMDDPDAPSGTFTHWLVWNIAPGTRELVGAAQPDGTIGKNDFGKTTYSGPNPPSGEHRYAFHLSALNIKLNLPAGATRKQLDAAMQGHILATTTLTGRYAKTATFQH